MITGLNYSKILKLDASETLFLEGDPDLKYLKEINRDITQEVLVLTYTPNEKMISDQSINNLV